MYFIYVNYRIASAASAEAAKRIPTRMVPLNRNFSNPRRVWKPVPKLFPSPNAPPKPALDCWRSTPATRSTANTICMYGRMADRVFIAWSIAYPAIRASFTLPHLVLHTSTKASVKLACMAGGGIEIHVQKENAGLGRAFLRVLEIDRWSINTFEVVLG